MKIKLEFSPSEDVTPNEARKAAELALKSIEVAKLVNDLFTHVRTMNKYPPESVEVEHAGTVEVDEQFSLGVDYLSDWLYNEIQNRNLGIIFEDI